MKLEWSSHTLQLRTAVSSGFVVSWALHTEIRSARVNVSLIFCWFNYNCDAMWQCPWTKRRAQGEVQKVCGDASLSETITLSVRKTLNTELWRSLETSFPLDDVTQTKPLPPFRSTSRNREDPSLHFAGFAVVANAEALTENMFLPGPVRKLRKTPRRAIQH